MVHGTTILDIIENGILIVDRELSIRFWNNWLVTHTGIAKEEAQGNKLTALFPDTSFSLLKRKVKIALRLNSSTFANSSVEEYIVPISLKKITKSIFRHMRQDVVITPLNDTEVSIIIYDATPILEAKSIIDDQLLLMEKQATTDALTQCYNRKMFNDLLAAEVKTANRYNRTFSVIIFDIDNFKSVNDIYGHLVGDEVIKAVASLAKESIRQCDVFARWGGEEFIFLLPETAVTGAATLANKVRSKIAGHDFGTPGHKTCSFGVAQYSPQEKIKSLLNNADRALYYAKNHGKDQVAINVAGNITTFSP